ncbi:MAG: hypothetical protein CMF25_08330 [Kangiellaceae bacterium]|nr:hypothetical protein [Kangiellaceae bacterium]|tara:strand:- start:6110 stop:6907 length:798 start_codon:yes stop_codon:yes gene_type:complete
MIESLLSITLSTTTDVLPIIGIIFFFQLIILKKRIPNLQRVLTGLAFVIVGLSFFLLGLEKALFPLGKMMAEQLTSPDFAVGTHNAIVPPDWYHYLWIYIFAFAIGFSTTIAEPSLIAVAIKANEVSAGSISVWGLRIAVAIGVAIGIALGTYRIVSGYPIHYFIIAGYMIVVWQTTTSPKMIIPLAYDSGGVTTSTVTVPLVAALGLGLAESVPGRDPLIDGFGLIAFASLFPMITVMAYAQISHYRNKKSKQQEALEEAQDAV